MPQAFRATELMPRETWNAKGGFHRPDADLGTHERVEHCAGLKMPVATVFLGLCLFFAFTFGLAAADAWIRGARRSGQPEKRGFEPVCL
jgi:hypothetical protein